MKKTLIGLLACCLFAVSLNAQEVDSAAIEIQKIEESLHYTTGKIRLENGNASINVPKGFQFLDKKQSQYVLTDLWGNPEDTSIIGLLVPEGRGVMAGNSWVYAVSYEEMGHISDDDAEDIDYEELLQQMKEDAVAENAEREKAGYQPVSLIGWAAAPFYDKDKKILHWAKEFKFGKDSLNTLNYNLRILGRKGLFMLNAVATMNELSEVKASINPVISSITFDKGSTYSDFDPDVDEVAAWTIGGLVAGKILAKVGFFAIILKFWKLIALGVVAGASAVWRFIRGKKKEEENEAAEADETPTQTDSVPQIEEKKEEEIHNS